LNSYQKERHPGDDGIDEPTREYGGRFNRRTLLLGGASGVAILCALYALAGITTEPQREEPKGLQPASISARVPEAPAPQVPKVETSPARETAAQETGRSEPERGQERRTQQAKRAPKNFKVSMLAFGNKHMTSMMSPLLEGSGRVREDRKGGGGGMPVAAGTEPRGGGANAKEDFYTGGGGRSKQGLYHPHSLQPELSGCVLKAGEELIIQNPNPVRTELPGQVRGILTEDAYGRIFLGGGRVRECLAIPAGSTVMTEVNATGVSRGDMRVQMCATRIDLLGGGIMPMACSPALGQDGASGVEAESDYAWSGIATGILIEGALSFVGALGGLIEGPAGVAVNVGTQGIRGVGGEYVNRELMRPPVLTMRSGAIYRIQINSDIPFPEK
jgi:type IV secretory pathway VirB10-like protein